MEEAFGLLIDTAASKYLKLYYITYFIGVINLFNDYTLL